MYSDSWMVLFCGDRLLILLWYCLSLLDMIMNCEIIAEIGSVHDGSLGNALKLISAAASCGADVVKFQTHIADTETLPDAPMPSYFKGEPRYSYFERTAFTPIQWKLIKKHCEENGVGFLSSPFSVEAVDLLEEVGVHRYKVPSGEITNLPLLEKIGRTGKPVLLSSGMSSWQELDDAVNLINKANRKITVMQCTSEYPCPYENVGLNVMAEMRNRYNLPVGFSDHTVTLFASYAAAVLGASVIERHFTFSRKMYGSDAAHSLEPEELAELVKGVRAIETMMAHQIDKDDIGKFSEMKRIFEKSLVTVVNVPKGSKITKEMIGYKKPGTGIPPKKIGLILGKTAIRDLEKDELISFDDVQ
jgi:N,N'-diacetyllegionaminate synthase